MYSEDSRRKLYYLLTDMITLTLTYSFLSNYYNYLFFQSKFFIVIFALLIIIFGVLTDEYSSISGRGYLKEAKGSFFYAFKVLIFFCFVLILGKFRYLSDISQMSYGFLLAILFTSSILVFAGRILIKTLRKNSKIQNKKVLLLSNFTNSVLLEGVLSSKHYQIVAYISDKTKYDSRIPVLKGIKEIRGFLRNNQVDEIFVDADARTDYMEMTNYFRLLGIPTTVSIGESSDYYVGDSVIKKLGPMTFVTTAINIVKFRQVVLKRIIDIVVSIIGVILTGIVALFIMPIVKKQSPGPLFFKQKRVGKNGKVFDIYKFRSMYMDAEERKKELLSKNDLDSDLMFKMDNDPRIFPFGQKIRDWSIDELPQFINVLKGEMSVVGTRPPTLDEYKKYKIHHFKRLATKPGITGLWQVSGRSNITDFEEVVALDLQYIQNWSISQDIKIIAKTFAVVLRKEGSK